jgi:predicted enzyme related to lactoylglutathione lyase
MSEVTAPYQPGVPCWLDLSVPDQRAALDFYGDLFGWQGEPGPPETGGYAICTLRGKPVAGIMTAMAPPGSPTPPTAWTTYLATADVDAAVRAVSEGGGTVIAPAMDVMEQGRMAVAADPSGAVFGLWQARDFTGSLIVNEPGAVIWSELATPDPRATAPFYVPLGITSGPMPGAEGFLALSVEGRMIGSARGQQDDPPGTPPHWLTYFMVDDTDSTVDALVRAGGTVLAPPFDMIAGRMAVVADPQGAVFALIHPRPMGDDA